MRLVLRTIVAAALALMQAGCAADFHAGGPHRGVDAEAAVGPVYVMPPPR
jgi:hypothetical protein